MADHMENFVKGVTQYVKTNDDVPDELLYNYSHMNSRHHADQLHCAQMPIPEDDKVKLLTTDKYEDRLKKTLITLNKQNQLLQIKQKIKRKTYEDLDDQQREYFCNSRSRISARNWATKTAMKTARN